MGLLGSGPSGASGYLLLLLSIVHTILQWLLACHKGLPVYLSSSLALLPI